MINKFMQEAILLSIENVKIGGGPFGAIIVRDDKIIATRVNSVIRNNDPTAHAEIQAIRQACERLQDFNLSGCIMYSSCEPCPMCLGAIYWAHIDKVYYCNSREDAKKIGFADDLIYSELAIPTSKRIIPFIHIDLKKAKEAFILWEELENKIIY